MSELASLAVACRPVLLNNLLIKHKIGFRSFSYKQTHVGLIWDASDILTSLLLLGHFKMIIKVALFTGNLEHFLDKTFHLNN